MQNPQTYPCWFTASNSRHYEAILNFKKMWVACPQHKQTKSVDQMAICARCLETKQSQLGTAVGDLKKLLLPLLHGIFTIHPNLLSDKCCLGAAWEDAWWGARARQQGVGRSSLAATERYNKEFEGPARRGWEKQKFRPEMRWLWKWQWGWLWSHSNLTPVWSAFMQALRIRLHLDRTSFRTPCMMLVKKRMALQPFQLNDSIMPA